MNAQPPPVIDGDPYASDVLANPHPFHQLVRDAAPVVMLGRYDAFAMGRYEEVRSTFRDWQTFESGSGVGLSNFRVEEPWRPPSLLLEADPPRHDAPRHVLSSLLSPAALHGLRDEWTRVADGMVDELIGCLPSGSTIELDGVADIAEVYPLRVFPEAVGLGTEGLENLLPYGELAFNMFGPRNELAAVSATRMGELSAWVGQQCVRESLAEGGLGSRIWQSADRGDILPSQAPLIVRSLLTAGVDTTVLGIGSLLHAVSTHSGTWTRLADEPDLIRVAFDEAVRWVSPVQTFFRTTTHDTEVAGTAIPSGSKVLLFLGSANRDPRRWERPEVFDLDRDPSGHVGFGFGLHQCVGQHVARLEAECLMRALAGRVSDIRAAAPPTPRINNTLRGWSSMPLRLTVA